jgi:hydrogenase expression/formation protein HypE
VKILTSIRQSAQEANIKIVAGDTKVVRQGEADRIFINTTGVGIFARESLKMRDVQTGDKIILSGPIGNHTIHLLSIREGLGFETRVLSDCAPLNGMIDTLFSDIEPFAIRSIRDVTRGGLGAVLHEYATALGKTMHVEKKNLPIQEETVMAADMLGVNPIHLANEGCLCLFVDPRHADSVLSCMKAHKYGRLAVVIGEVVEKTTARVQMMDSDNRLHHVEELEGAELPRLC